MADQYHYDKDGNYTGRVSETPPSSGSGSGSGCGRVGIIIVAVIIGAILKDDEASTPESPDPDPSQQEEAQPTGNDSLQEPGIQDNEPASPSRSLPPKNPKEQQEDALKRNDNTRKPVGDGASLPGKALELYNLGVTSANKGDFDKAIVYHDMALQRRLKALGSDHPDVAASYTHNLE